MKKKIILLIEDNELLAENISEILHNYSIIVTKNPRTGIEAVRERHPSIIIYDNNKKVHNIHELTQSLNLGHDLYKVPIIFLTHALEKKGKDPEDNPAFHFINKPFDPDELLETVKIQFKHI